MSQERATNNINNQVTMYFCFPYYEKKGDTSSSIKKSVHCKNTPIVFKIMYDVTEVELFCNTRIVPPSLCRSNIVYEFVCSGSLANYNGKTERTYYERYAKHGWLDKNSSITQYFNECTGVENIMNLIFINSPLLNDNVHNKPLGIKSSQRKFLPGVII